MSEARKERDRDTIASFRDFHMLSVSALKIMVGSLFILVFSDSNPLKLFGYFLLFSKEHISLSLMSQIGFIESNNTISMPSDKHLCMMN